MTHHLNGLMVDLCLRFLRARFRLVVIVVEDCVNGDPWARYGVRGGRTTVGGACTVAGALRQVADQLHTEAETAVIIERTEKGLDLL